TPPRLFSEKPSPARRAASRGAAPGPPDARAARGLESVIASHRARSRLEGIRRAGRRPNLRSCRRAPRNRPLYTFAMSLDRKADGWASRQKRRDTVFNNQEIGKSSRLRRKMSALE